MARMSIPAAGVVRLIAEFARDGEGWVRFSLALVAEQFQA
jgi:hypothetical protein